LEYYPSLRVIRRLHEMSSHADAKVREEARDSYESIRNELLNRLCDTNRRVAAHIRRWLRPVWDILAMSEEELSPDEDEGTPPRGPQPGEAMPVTDLLALLTDPDASPKLLEGRLQRKAWAVYDKEDRGRLRTVLLTHPDQFVREQAARAFVAWQDLGGLLELVGDGDFCVRKTAMYQLGQFPPTPGIADLAWDHLHRHDALGTHGTETLATFVKHASRAVAASRLGCIAGDHGRREELRAAAVHHLAALGAAEQVGQLTGLLLEPPVVTWALHLALLDAITDLGLAMPGIGHLRAIDNLHVKAALARVEVGLQPVKRLLPHQEGQKGA
jgi:hypothetical protein